MVSLLGTDKAPTHHTTSWEDTLTGTLVERGLFICLLMTGVMLATARVSVGVVEMVT